jgi:hypothetical protein
MNGGAWQTETLFSGLEPNTSYGFEVRKSETATHFASPASEASQFSTDKATLGGVVTISGNAVFGETLTVDVSGLSSEPSAQLGNLNYQWKRGEINIGTDVTYTIAQADIDATITVTVTAANCEGSVISAATETITKAMQTAPEAPTLANNSNNTITLNAIAGCEYRMNGGAWQTETLFSGLEPNTSYGFEARKAETATYFASPASEVVQFSTTNDVGIDDMLLSEITIYPNPCTAFVIIKGAAGADLKIVNMIGETVKELYDMSELQEIYMDNLASGVYMFKLTKDSNFKTVKIIKN